MDGLELWRARIGTFCCAMGARKGKRKPDSSYGKHVKQASVCNILLNYTCLCVILAMTLSCKETVTSSVLTPFAEKGIISEYRPTVLPLSLLADVATTSCEPPFPTDHLTQLAHPPTPLSMDVSLSLSPVMIYLYFSVILLRGGDIETNPGPNNKQTNGKNDTSSVLEETINTKFSNLESQIAKVLSSVQLVNKALVEQTERLVRIEQDQKDLKASVSGLKQEIDDIRSVTNQNHETTSKSLENLQDEIDRLESYSRRNNMKLFGIREQGPHEDCVDVVKSILKEISPEENWTEDVIERAHRIGHFNDNNPNSRPIIARFQRWGDLMKVMKNRQGRSKLQENGVKIAQDLTKRQAARLRSLREEGKVGFYVNGKLKVRDQRDRGGIPSNNSGEPLADPVSPQPMNNGEITGDTAIARESSLSPRAAFCSPTHRGTRSRTGSRSATKKTQDKGEDRQKTYAAATASQPGIPSPTAGNSSDVRVSRATEGPSAASRPTPAVGLQTRSASSTDRQSTLGAWANATRKRANRDSAADATSPNKE